MSDQMSEETKRQAAETAMGVVQELARRGGYGVGQPQGVGELVVKGVAAVAPGAVAVAVAGTAATISAVTAVAVAAAPFAVIAGAGYGAYRLAKWLMDD